MPNSDKYPCEKCYHYGRNCPFWGNRGGDHSKCWNAPLDSSEKPKEKQPFHFLFGKKREQKAPAAPATPVETTEKENPCNETLPDPLKAQKQELADLNIRKMHAEAEIEHKKNALQTLEEQVLHAQKELDDLQKQLESTRSQIIETDEEKLLQDVAFYNPVYQYSSSSEYADAIRTNRDAQKAMIRSKKAVTCNIKWYVNSSLTEGKKLISRSITQTLMCFNLECDNVISHVSFKNFESMKRRIENIYVRLTELNAVHQIEINPYFLSLKIDELTLAYEMERKKEEEKEERRVQRELQREQKKVLEELEAERKRLEKEDAHYSNLLVKLKERQMQGMLSGEELNALQGQMSDAEEKLKEIEKAIQDVDYRKANQKAGYVYVISNIGAFGEGVYKIGMTRRLDPLDRIAELSGASVPFRFDVHALLFSDDAPALEAVLHRTFADKRVNRINNRKEFFRVTLEEIEKVVKENYDKIAEFTTLPDAQEYRETLSLSKNKGGNEDDLPLQ